MQLQLVESDVQKKIVKNIIEKHHSYVPTAKSVGRRIDWLIYEDDKFPSECIGMIGIGSSVYPPPKDMLNYIGMSKNEYKDNFNSFANNWTHLITFVGGGNNGAVYKADNWNMIGETAGLPKHKVVSMKWNNKEELKQLFVKPTGENKKLIFAIHLN